MNKELIEKRNIVAAVIRAAGNKVKHTLWNTYGDHTAEFYIRGFDAGVQAQQERVEKLEAALKKISDYDPLEIACSKRLLIEIAREALEERNG